MKEERTALRSRAIDEQLGKIEFRPRHGTVQWTCIFGSIVQRPLGLFRAKGYWFRRSISRPRRLPCAMDSWTQKGSKSRRILKKLP